MYNNFPRKSIIQLINYKTLRVENVVKCHTEVKVYFQFMKIPRSMNLEYIELYISQCEPKHTLNLSTKNKNVHYVTRI
jgi:hypothetical protein